MVTHVVLFKLKDGSPDSLARTAAVLRSMNGEIPSLQGLEVGVRPPGNERTWDIALVTRFEDWDGLKAYRNHPFNKDTVLPHMHEAASEARTVDYKDGVVL